MIRARRRPIAAAFGQFVHETPDMLQFVVANTLQQITERTALPFIRTDDGAVEAFAVDWLPPGLFAIIDSDAFGRPIVTIQTRNEGQHDSIG